MFKARSLLLLGIALILALASVFVARQWVASVKQPPAQVVETEPVVVAAVQISSISRIRPGDVRILYFPKEGLSLDPSLKEASTSFFNDPSEVIGKYVTQTIYPNEPIVRERLRDHLGGSGLSHVVTPGMRAVSISVNDVTGVSGFVMPGNRIDLLSVRKLPNSELVSTQVIMQNAKVLAVDQQVSDDEDKPHNSRTVTLELLPQDAAIVVQAADSGTVQMTLRNPMDKLAISSERPEITQHANAGPVRRTAPRTATTGYTRIVSLGGKMETYRCTQAHCVTENKLDPGVMTTPQAVMASEPVESEVTVMNPVQD